MQIHCIFFGSVDLLWRPNSTDLNPVDYSVWDFCKEKVFKIFITDLDELKQRRRTEWPRWNDVVIAAAIRQWRRR